MGDRSSGNGRQVRDVADMIKVSGFRVGPWGARSTSLVAN